MAQHHVEGCDYGKGLPDERRVPVLPHPEKQERRRHTKADGVAQAVQLAAEIAGGLRQPRRVAVQGVEDHGGEDQQGTVAEVDLVGLGADVAGDGNGREAADCVAEGQESRQNGYLSHVAKIPWCPSSQSAESARTEYDDIG